MITIHLIENCCLKYIRNLKFKHQETISEMCIVQKMKYKLPEHEKYLVLTLTREMQNYSENSSQPSQNDHLFEHKKQNKTKAVGDEEKREPLYAAGGHANYPATRKSLWRFLK